MYKFFKKVGLIALVIASFMYTEKLVSVVKEYDEIMIQINKEKDKYEIKPKEAKIEGNKMIPGISGKKVNVQKSYYKMKQYGKYDDRLYEYTNIEPSYNIKENKDKFIIKGNSKKNMVSLIILENKNLENIINILNENKLKSNIFVDYKWTKKHEKDIIDLSNKKYIFGNIDTNINNISKNNKIIKSLTRQKNNYCLVYDYNEKVKNECVKSKNYTIFSNIILKNDTFMKLKNEITPGSIIVIDNLTNNNFYYLINYIKNKGYEIVTLDYLLEE